MTLRSLDANTIGARDREAAGHTGFAGTLVTCHRRDELVTTRSPCRPESLDRVLDSFGTIRLIEEVCRSSRHPYGFVLPSQNS